MILLLTAGFGDGHNTAARNVAAALARLAPGEPVKVVDLCDEAHRLLAPVVKSGYQMLITRLPALWGAFFKHSARTGSASRHDFAFRGLQRALVEVLARERPRAIVTTYLVYSGLLENCRDAGIPVPPVFSVITDSITIHPLWTLGPSTRWFVADIDSKPSLASLGIPEQDIAVTGFPVSLDFMIEPPDAPTLRSPRILYLPSTSEGHVRRTLEALRPAIAAGARLTLPLGKHYPRLYQVATRFADTLPEGTVEMLGWTKQIPRLLQTHDLVICKAGGAILHEALAACCPAIIDYIVPGQEEGNAELLVKHDCGIVSRTPEETGLAASRLLAQHRNEAIRMKHNMHPHSLPDASLRIAQEVLTHSQPKA